VCGTRIYSGGFGAIRYGRHLLPVPWSKNNKYSVP
jgi:hypothetical protein